MREAGYENKPLIDFGVYSGFDAYMLLFWLLSG